jgi:hypothetical protein
MFVVQGKKILAMCVLVLIWITTSNETKKLLTTQFWCLVVKWQCMARFVSSTTWLYCNNIGANSSSDWDLWLGCMLRICVRSNFLGANLNSFEANWVHTPSLPFFPFWSLASPHFLRSCSSSCYKNTYNGINFFKQKSILSDNFFFFII